MVLGVHNYEVWLDITDIGTDETFEGVVDGYYHFQKACDYNNSRCRCGAPWKGLDCAAKPLLRGMSVHTSINNNEPER